MRAEPSRSRKAVSHEYRTEPLRHPLKFVREIDQIGRGSMLDRRDHAAWAADAVAVFQSHCQTGDQHAIADLICDLGHLAEQRGLDFVDEVRRGIGHWYAEQHANEGDILGPDAAVEIIIEPR
jgi:hypothetical protein